MPAALCAFCNKANAAGSKFCNECGAALRLTLCPECEAVNDRMRTECYKCGADLHGSAMFAPAATASVRAGLETETLGEQTPPTASEPVEATSEALAELDSVRGTGADDFHRGASMAHSFGERTATATPPMREAVAAPSPVREAVILVPPRSTSRSTAMPFAIIGLLVISAAAYYGYRNGSFTPATAWLNSTPSDQALERRASRWGAGNPDAESQARETTGKAPDTGSDSSTPTPSVEDGRTAQAPAVAATSAAPSAAPNEGTTQSPVSTPSVQLPAQSPIPPPAAPPQSAPVRNAVPPSSGDRPRERVDRPRERVVNRSAAVVTAPATTQPSPAPDNAASAKAPAHCSDAAAAMGLCNQDKSREGN